MRRTLIVTAATALLGLGLTGQAGAVTTPPDCSTTLTSSATAVMTCTARPATQHWHLYVECTGPWADTDATGNSVVGNGSSTATCRFGRASYPTFVPE